MEDLPKNVICEEQIINYEKGEGYILLLLLSIIVFVYESRYQVQFLLSVGSFPRESAQLRRPEHHDNDSVSMVIEIC